MSCSNSSFGSSTGICDITLDEDSFVMLDDDKKSIHEESLSSTTSEIFRDNSSSNEPLAYTSKKLKTFYECLENHKQPICMKIFTVDRVYGKTLLKCQLLNAGNKTKFFLIGISNEQVPKNLYLKEGSIIKIKPPL